RQKLGIPDVVRRGRRWTSLEDELVGALSDAEAASRLKRTRLSVEARRRQLGLPNAAPRKAPPSSWNASQMKLLGRFTDREVARRLGRDADAVRYKRQCLGIAPLNQLSRKRWTKAEEKLLGTLEDAALARQLGRTELS